jgi:hypothetical protein
VKAKFSVALGAAMAMSSGLWPMQASADDTGGDNGISIDLGTFLLNTHTSVRVDGAREGSELDLREDLGYEDLNRFRIDAAWRFAERHTLRAMYFDNSRTQTKVINRTLQIGDTTYPIGVDLTSEFSTRIADLTYEYTFLQKPKYQLAASFGLHSVSFGLDMQADVTLPGTTTQARLAESVDTGAPLPLVGMRGAWQLSDHWTLEARAQYFFLSMDGYDGSISDMYAGATWMFSEHVGLGLGYNQFRFRVDVDQRSFNGDMSWRYGGALAFLRAAF